MNMATADRVCAVIFCTLGLAMLIGGYTMDRLEIRQIHPLSVPGLLPMILGGALAFCAMLLWVQADGGSAGGRERLIESGSLWRLGQTVGLTLFYAIVLVGWLPFTVATAIFIASFTAVFSWTPEASAKMRMQKVLSACAFGVVAALVIGLLFEKAFLVRLP